jgi:PPE-repeat protein
VSTVAASLIALSVSLPAFANWSNPTLADVTASVTNIVAEISDVAALTQLDAKNIKVVYLEDILTSSQLSVIKNSLNNPITKLNILTLQNVLNLKNVLDGNSVLSFGQFLSNNNTAIGNVIAIDHFNDGGIIVFCCH